VSRVLVAKVAALHLRSNALRAAAVCSNAMHRPHCCMASVVAEWHVIEAQQCCIMRRRPAYILMSTGIVVMKRHAMLIEDI
jgi:hypothetical protein